MGKRRIYLKPGDVIEVPIGDGWLAYARKYEDISYRPYQIVAKERRNLSEIIPSGFLELMTVFEYESEVGNWPRIGRHPFQPDEDPWPPPEIQDNLVYEKGRFRPGTSDDLAMYRPIRRYDADEFVDYLRATLLAAGPLARPVKEQAVVVDLLANAMSVDRNDVAERVAIEFGEFVNGGDSPAVALRKTIRECKEEFDGDSDTMPPFWLALAAIGLKHNCLTKSVRDKAMKIIESGQCWDIVDNVDKKKMNAAYAHRREAIDRLKTALIAAADTPTT